MGVLECVCVCVCVGVYVCLAFTAKGEKGVLSVPKGCPPTHPHHAPYWDLREREQSLQNQRAKSPCYTSPIFGTSPTFLLHGASHPPSQYPNPLVRGWRASLKRAGVLLWRYLISHSTANCHPAPPLPLPPHHHHQPPLLFFWNHHHLDHLLCLHPHRLNTIITTTIPPSPLCSMVPSSLLSLSLSPVISQGMGERALLGCRQY